MEKIKTSVRYDDDLLRIAKYLAIDDKTTFQIIANTALREYLIKRGKLKK